MTTAHRSDIEILRPLNDDELEDLRELYNQKYGASSFQYLLIHTQCNWNKRLKQMHIKDTGQQWISFRKVFYTHKNKSYRKYGTFVCLHEDIVQSVSFHTWEPDLNELLECLDKTNLILWKNGPLLINVADSYSEQVKKLVLAKGGIIQKARRCHGFLLNHAVALNLNVANLSCGYILGKLQEQHAELVHSLWPNNKEGSLQYIKGLIKVNNSLGVFEESSGNLVGWIFQNEFSGLGILQVLPMAQRRGLGKVLATALSKLIAQSDGVCLSAWAVVENVKSINLLQNVGYEKAVIYEWIQLKSQ